MTTYIAHNCPHCEILIYIVDGKTFSDTKFQPVTNCPNCNRLLRVPRGLADMIALESENWSDDVEL